MTYTIRTKDGQEFDPEDEKYEELSYNSELNSLQQVIEGLLIARESGMTYLPGAEHDIIYGPSPEDLTLEQVENMFSVGWHIEDGEVFARYV